MTVSMIPVESTNIAAIGYDIAASDLFIKFNNGQTYVHHKVPATKYAAFLSSQSKGGHYHKTFRGNAEHPHELVKPEEKEKP